MAQELNNVKDQVQDKLPLREKESKKRLYIIGNGFDLYHGLPTSYRCYNCYMCREHPEVHERVGRIFDINDPNMLWLKYEEKLGELDVYGLVDRNLPWWVETEEQDELTYAFDTLHADSVDYFQEWAGQIDTAYANSKRLELDKNAYFINFNYTETLEKDFLYQIQSKQICYIHGDTGKNPLRRTIVGHGNNQYVAMIDEEKISNMIKSFQKFPEWAKTMDRFKKIIISEIKRLLNGLEKKTDKCIVENKAFLKKCTKSDEIYVLGHSLADVDLPYFEKIARESDTAKWYVSYYNDIVSLKKQIGKIHNIGQVEFITLDELKKTDAK